MFCKKTWYFLIESDNEKEPPSCSVINPVVPVGIGKPEQFSFFFLQIGQDHFHLGKRSLDKKANPFQTASSEIFISSKWNIITKMLWLKDMLKLSIINI